MAGRSNEEVSQILRYVSKAKTGDQSKDLASGVFRAVIEQALLAGTSKEEAYELALNEARKVDPSFQPELLEGFWEA